MGYDRIAARAAAGIHGRWATYIPCSGPTARVRVMQERASSRADPLGLVAAPADVVHIQVEQLAEAERGAVLQFEDNGETVRIDGPADTLDQAIGVYVVVPCQ